ncbi:MAG: helix-turn-helix domain-containing protein [Patescibacteria group bacterium]
MTSVSKTGLRILGLNKKEFEIVQALKECGPLRPIDLAKTSLVKRTTVNFLLQRLQKRGLVQRIRVRGHYEWLMREEEEIRKLMKGLYLYLGSDDGRETIQLPSEIGVEVIKGKKNIMAAYEKVLTAGYNSRVLAIQGNRSVAASVNLEKSYLSSIQSEFKKYRIIIEGIIGEDSLGYLENLPADQLEIYTDRMVVCYVVNNAVVDFDMDIIIFKKTVMMINFEKNLVLVVRNENIYEALFNMFEALKLAGRKIDLNAFVKELIEEDYLKNKKTAKNVAVD